MSQNRVSIALYGLFVLAFANTVLGVERQWTGAAGTPNWHDPANWSPIGVPGAQDDVVLGLALTDVVSISTGFVSVQSVQCAQTLRVEGNATLVTSNTFSITGRCETLNSGVVGAQGDFVVAGQLEIGGQGASASRLIIEPTGTAVVATAHLANTDINEIYNQGTIQWKAGFLLATLVNNSGTFESNSVSNLLMQAQQQVCVFNNNGVFSKLAANTTTLGVASASVQFNNSGTVHVSAGTLDQVGGGINTGLSGVDVGATYSVAGNHTASARSHINVQGTFQVTGGTYVSDGTLQIMGTVRCRGGAIATFNGAIDCHSGTLATQDSLTSLTITGPLDIEDGTFNALGGTVNLGEPERRIKRFVIRASLFGQGDIRVTSSGDWQAGTLNAGGRFIVEPGCDFLMTTGFSSRILRRDFENHGIVRWVASDIAMRNATFTNYSEFAIENTSQVNFTVSSPSTTNVFENYGTVVMRGNGRARFSYSPSNSVIFNNHSICRVQSNTLVIGRGTHDGPFICEGGFLIFSGNNTLTDKSSIESYGTLVIEGQSFSCAAPIYSAPGTEMRYADGDVNYTNGVANFTGPLVVEGLLRSRPCSGCIVNFENTVTMGAAATLTLEGTIVNFSQPLEVGTLNVHGGVLGGAGDVLVHSAFSCFSAMTGSGRTIVSEGISTLITTNLTLGRTLENHGAITLEGGPYTFVNGAIENHGTLVFDAPGLTEIVTLQLGAGTGAIINNAVMTKSGPGAVRFTAGMEMQNHGQVLLNQGQLQLQGGGQHNGTITAAANATLQLATTISYGNDSLIQGAGNVQFAGGTHDIPAGTLAATGQWQFNSGTIFLNDAFAPGSLSPVAATVVLNVPKTFTSMTLQSPGVITGPGDLTVNTLVFSGGTMSGTGVTTASNAFLATNGTRNLSRNLIVTSALNWNGAGVLAMNNCQITCSGNFNANQTGTAQVYGVAGTSAIVLTGTLTKTNTSQTLFTVNPVGVALHNLGTINLSAGQLHVQSGVNEGTITAAAGSVVQFASNWSHPNGSLVNGAGTLRFTGGTHAFSNGSFAPTGPVEFTAGQITINNPFTPSSLGTITAHVILNAPQTFTSATLAQPGVLDGAGDLSIASALSWTGGTMSGTGITTIARNATASLTSTTTKSLHRNLINEGTCTWSGGNLQLTNAELINSNLLTLNHSVALSLQGEGACRLQNAGSLIKLGSGITTLPSHTGGVSLSNTGVVQVQSGALKLLAGVEQLQGNTLEGGEWIVSANATLEFPLEAPAQLASLSGAVVRLLGVGSSLPGISRLSNIDNGGVFELGSGRTLNVVPVEATFNNSGLVRVGPGSWLDIDGGFVNAKDGQLHLAVQTITDIPIRCGTTAEFAGSLSVQVAPALSITAGQQVQLVAATQAIQGKFASFRHTHRLACLLELGYSPSAALLQPEATLPIALCQNVNLQLQPNGTATLAPSQVNAGSSDSCNLASLHISKTTFTCADVGENIVTLTAIDSAGNTNTCEAVVTVIPTGHYLGDDGGSWFDPANWCSGVPSEIRSAMISQVVLVNELGAVANTVTLQDGGELRVGGATGGSLHVANSINVHSGGTLSILANGNVSGASITIHAGGTLAMFDETAILSLTDLIFEEGAFLQWIGGTIEINGVWTNPPATHVHIGCQNVAAALILVENGSVLADQMTICTDGSVRGTGSVWANVQCDGHLAPGQSIGTLLIEGDLHMSNNSTCDLDIMGAGVNDLLQITGEAALSGTLRVTFANDFTPSLNETWDVLIADSHVGVFSSYEMPAQVVNRYLRVIFESGAVRLHHQKIGDANADGLVGVADLLNVIGQWGSCAGTNTCSGDISPLPAGDHAVSVPDLLLVISNWGG